MPRTLPAELTAAMNAVGFTAYFAIGKRNYTGDPPSALASYTTLITAIMGYTYNGLNLTVKYASSNLPANDGLIIGNKYYIERGILANGVHYTIRSASLRFDNYSITKQIITAQFSLFSNEARTPAISGEDTYENILTALNPNDYELGTVNFKIATENPAFWGYQFYPAGRQVSLKSHAQLLPLINQKYLLQAVDNSDDDNEDEIQFFHLGSPLETAQFVIQDCEVGSHWNDICWSPELSRFVAIGRSVTGQAFQSYMTSPDGIAWTNRGGGNKDYQTIAWSPSLYLFVVLGGDLNYSTSPDGINWQGRTNIADRNWGGICWSPQLGIFVAVNSNTTGTDQVATSTTGTSWTLRNASGAYAWHRVIWVTELSLFVAIAYSATTHSVMTSPNGITWTQRTTPSGSYMGICWSAELSLLVIVGQSNSIATSPNGITWTARTAPNSNIWNTVEWSPTLGIFVALADNGTNNRIMTSPDGITWTAAVAPDANYIWKSICWSPELSRFVAVANDNNITDPGVLVSIAPTATDHTIEQGDITLLKNAPQTRFLWRDEHATIHSTGVDEAILHNLGYLESTAAAPASFQTAGRALATIGIHLKYKSGDIFKLMVNGNQSATYYGQVTEILDPKAPIGWRTEIQLFERFKGTEGGALPSTIEAAAPYTPLVTGHFNGILNANANNIQAAMEMIDDHEHAGSGSGATPHAPGGRLTLATGTPVPTSDQLAKTSIYWTPFNGDLAPLYDGSSSWTEENISELTLALDSDTGHTNYHQSGKSFDLWLYKDSGTWRLVSGPAWTNDTTPSQATQLINGIEVNSASFTGRFGSLAENTLTVAQYMGVYVGSFRASANGQTADAISNTVSTATYRYIWNRYNQVQRKMLTGNSNASWSYASSIWRESNNGAGALRAYFIMGRLTSQPIIAGAYLEMTPNTSITSYYGVALDNVNQYICITRKTGITITVIQAGGIATPSTPGYHSVILIEYAGGTTQYTGMGTGFGHISIWM